MKYHMIGFLLGFIIDLMIGDPVGIPHPVIGMGKLIAFWDSVLLHTDGQRNPAGERLRGVLLVIGVLVPVLLIGGGVYFFCLRISVWAGVLCEALITWQLLAVRDLKKESMLVYKELEKGDLEAARYAVSRIVGRDTAELDMQGVIRAAVETVAENTSDGAIAPMLFLAFFGPVGGLFYKAVNTMDSMVGYKNDRYLYFGTAAAKLDDFVNFIPARISAVLMILSCIPGQAFDAKNAWRIFLRDRYQHKSPNSAQTESAAAGALGLKLGGDSFYFGKLVSKPTIGDAKREAEPEDIRKANVLLYRTAFLTEILCLAVMLLTVLVG